MAQIVNVSHYDLDGVGCQVLIKHLFDNGLNQIEFKQCGYGKINNMIRNATSDLSKWLVVTDISPDESWAQELIQDFPSKLMIDHHETAVHLHDPENNIHITPGDKSATRLLRDYFNVAYPDIDLSVYDRMVELIDDYDTHRLEYKESTGLNFLYWGFFGKFGHDSMRDRLFNKPFEFTPLEQAFIDKSWDEVHAIYNTLDGIQLDIIKGVVVMLSDHINEVIDLIIGNGTPIVFCVIRQSSQVSVRHQIDGINIGSILKDLGIGGGHANAGGFNVPAGSSLKDTILSVEEAIFNANLGITG